MEGYREILIPDDGPGYDELRASVAELEAEIQRLRIERDAENRAMRTAWGHILSVWQGYFREANQRKRTARQQVETLRAALEEIASDEFDADCNHAEMARAALGKE